MTPEKSSAEPVPVGPVAEPGSVSVESGAALSRLRVTGPLDAHAAARMGALCQEALHGEVRRLEVDLSSVTESTADGIAALTTCLGLARLLPDGVGVTVATDAGRRALLASMTAV